MVVDNEAGMEHISRGVLPTMQTAILVSDCSRRGIQAVGRIKKLIEECDMHPQQIGLIVNRAPNGVLNGRNQRGDRDPGPEPSGCGSSG